MCYFLVKKKNIPEFVEQIEGMIKQQFGLTIPVLVITIENLKDILNHAPNWWGNDNKEIYDNLIFTLNLTNGYLNMTSYINNVTNRYMIISETGGTIHETIRIIKIYCCFNTIPKEKIRNLCY